jgi:tRNA(Met) C34 N-acetyltransferase TmcA
VAADAAAAAAAAAVVASNKTKKAFPPNLLYHPFDCMTTIRKRMQAVLMTRKIDDIKAKFNESFKQGYGAKEREIDVINEKGKRIGEIQQELKQVQTLTNPHAQSCFGEGRMHTNAPLAPT